MTPRFLLPQRKPRIPRNNVCPSSLHSGCCLMLSPVSTCLSPLLYIGPGCCLLSCLVSTGISSLLWHFTDTGCDLLNSFHSFRRNQDLGIENDVSMLVPSSATVVWSTTSSITLTHLCITPYSYLLKQSLCSSQPQMSLPQGRSLLSLSLTSVSHFHDILPFHFTSSLGFEEIE